MKDKVVRLGIEAAEVVAPKAAAQLPGLLELAGVASKAPTASLVGAETRALMEAAAAKTKDPVIGAMLKAGESSGIPMKVDIGKITAVRNAMPGGAQELDAVLKDAFRPRGYAEQMRFYGG